MADAEQVNEAAEAYIYGYPLVYNLNEVGNFVEGAGSMPFQAPYNTFGYARSLLGPETKFVDAWTNNFAYIGRRATGTAEAEFLLTDRDDQGEIPDGMTVVRAPTGVFSIVGRVQIDGDFYLVANPIDRYSIGDRTPGLRTADDGSVTILMQTDSPGPDKESNWLPTPPGEVPPDPAHVPAAEDDPGWNLRPPRSPKGRLVGTFHVPVPDPAGDGQRVIRRAAIDGTPELWIATVDPQPAAGGSPGGCLNASTAGSGSESSEES